MNERVCFLLQLKPDRIEDYLAAHATVWPEVLDALRDAGWRNYSLFLHKDDGLVVGYLETDSFERATSQMARTTINTKWQAHMAEYFHPAGTADPADGANPDTARTSLVEYFHLD